MNNRIGFGKSSEIFEIENNRVHKLYFNVTPYDDIIAEYEATRKINNLGLPSAICYDLIQHNGRYGIVLDKINGVTMMKYMRKYPMVTMEQAKKLAQLHASIHTIQNPNLSQNIDLLRQCIDAVNLIPDTDKNKIYKYLKVLPAGNSLCHGDFHPENILLSNQKHFIIDWMKATQGNSCSDVARTDLLLRNGVSANKKIGIEQIIIDIIRRKFADTYLNTYIKSTTVKPESISDWKLPHMAAMLNDELLNSAKELFLIEIKRLLNKI
jgi:uncharacterized protein (TIGR02172 family)